MNYVMKWSYCGTYMMLPRRLIIGRAERTFNASKQIGNTKELNIVKKKVWKWFKILNRISALPAIISLIQHYPGQWSYVVRGWHPRKMWSKGRWMILAVWSNVAPFRCQLKVFLALYNSKRLDCVALRGSHTHVSFNFLMIIINFWNVFKNLLFNQSFWQDTKLSRTRKILIK